MCAIHFAMTVFPLHIALLAAESESRAPDLTLLRLDGVLPRPLSSGGLITGAVRLVHVRNFGNQGVVGVGVS